ncbi:hypothetical protein ACIHFE_12275 [Streptomyces sp. NPDC052396]|uniref:hypothetical protein n=1 Tax=Streptomyces sp. NPDC052396 TaxID=3365689 RepID=UPI0037D97DEA
MNSKKPPLGSFVVDTRTGRIGQVMDHIDSLVQLRPPGGGLEWDCPPDAASLTTYRAVLKEQEAEARLRRQLDQPSSSSG